MIQWIFLALGILSALIYGFVVAFTPKKKPYNSAEDYFLDPTTNTKEKFASIFDPASVELTIVFPAYNEEKRLSKTLDEAFDYLEKRQHSQPKFSYEVIVVSDGSKDKTVEIALGYSKKFGVNKMRVMELVCNRGKGGAVTQGMLRARGKLILFADADGATDIRDTEKLEKKLKEIMINEMSGTIGSRHHLVQTDAVVKRAFIRNLLMKVFHLLVYILGVQNIEDTQCGFKMLSRKAAQHVLPNMHVEGWIFDIELLILSNKFKVPLSEVGVNWSEIPGSKLDLIVDSFKMLKDLFIIRFNYTTRRWKVDRNPSKESLKKNE